jgi:PPM family protein phosphatase
LRLHRFGEKRRKDKVCMKNSTRGEKNVHHSPRFFNAHEGIQFAGLSDIGKQRENNEDFILFKDNLLLVADGVGGEEGGEIASKIACETIAAEFFAVLDKVKNPSVALQHAVKKANKNIFAESARKNSRMATTLCALYIHNNIVFYTHLGDSRIYMVREHKIKQLTEDHTLQSGNKRKKKANISERSNVLTKALGTGKPDIKVERLRLKEKDIFVLTTDGLTDCVSNDEILQHTEELHKPENMRNEQFCDRMIALANERGGKDNITVGIVSVNAITKKTFNKPLLYAPITLIFLAALLYAGKDYIKPYFQPVPNIIEEQLLTTHDFEVFINEWKSAWGSMDIELYGAFYAEDFFSSGMDRQRWLANKERVNSRKEWIEIDISDIGIEKENGTVTIKFIQNYRSSNYNSLSQKSLALKKHKNSWLITCEQ